MSGQTISDRLLAARHSIAGQGLAKSVCKATTEEVIGPKKKHLDYLIHCTNEPNVSIPQLANLLIERSQNTNWVVVFKSLVTAHHIMCYGNERFTQYLASSNCSFQLSNFLDKGNVAGYDMSPYIRRYAKYLNEKALAYRTVAFDFCKVKRGKEDGILRTMPADKLLKTVPALQGQIDALLEFDCSANDLTNGVVNTAFLLLFRDLIRLFACYNDGIINLLEKYFDMNKKQCKDALDFYKKFLVRMDRVAEFLKVAENVGIDKGDIPDLTRAPSSLLEALEAHLATLEGKKPSSSSSNINLAQHNGAMAANAEQIDESLKRQALAEEEAAMDQYKKSTNPFLDSPTAAGPSAPAASQQPIFDLFGGDMQDSSASNSNSAGLNSHSSSQKASDDLLQLAANPFASPTGASPAIPPLPNNSWSTAPTTQNAFGNTSNGSTNAESGSAHSSPAPPRPPPPGGASHLADLLSDISTTTDSTTTSTATTIPLNASTAGDFGNFDFLSMETSSAPPSSTATGNSAPAALISSPSKQVTQGFDAFGDLLQPSGNTGAAGAVPVRPANSSSNKVLTGDLDSSLASLAMNLTINKTQTPKNPQWSGAPKTGSNVMGGMQAAPGAGAQWNVQPMMPNPMNPNVQSQMPFRPMMAPMTAMNAGPFATPGQPTNAMAPGIRPMMGASPFGMAASTQAMADSNQQLDPFGAL